MSWRWRTVLGGALLALAIGAVVLPAAAPPPTQGDQEIVRASAVLSHDGELTRRAERPDLAVQARLATSPGVLEQVAARPEIDLQPAQLAAQVSAANDDDLGTLTITATASSEQESIDLVQAVAEELIRVVAEQRLEDREEEIATLEQRIVQRTERLRETEAALARVPPDSVDARVLQIRQESLIKAIRTDQERLEELLIGSGADADGLRLVSPAALAPAEGRGTDLDLPSGRLPRMLLLGVVGLVLGGGVALVAEHTDPRVRSRKIAERAFGLPVVAEFGTRGGSAEPYDRLCLALFHTPRWLLPPPSLGADGARDATRMEPVTGPVRVVLVTSVRHGTGSDRVAGELVRCMVAAGTRAMLLDVSDGGPAAARRALDGSPERADVVVVDGGPLLDGASAVHLLTEADAVIVVARSARTRVTDAEAVRSELARAQARVFGVVLISPGRALAVRPTRRSRDAGGSRASLALGPPWTRTSTPDGNARSGPGAAGGGSSGGGPSNSSPPSRDVVQQADTDASRPGRGGKADRVLAAPSRARSDAGDRRDGGLSGPSQPPAGGGAHGVPPDRMAATGGSDPAGAGATAWVRVPRPAAAPARDSGDQASGSRRAPSSAALLSATTRRELLARGRLVAAGVGVLGEVVLQDSVLPWLVVIAGAAAYVVARFVFDDLGEQGLWLDVSVAALLLGAGTAVAWVPLVAVVAFGAGATGGMLRAVAAGAVLAMGGAAVAVVAGTWVPRGWTLAWLLAPPLLAVAGYLAQRVMLNHVRGVEPLTFATNRALRTLEEVVRRVPGALRSSDVERAVVGEVRDQTDAPTVLLVERDGELVAVAAAGVAVPDVVVRVGGTPLADIGPGEARTLGVAELPWVLRRHVSGHGRWHVLSLAHEGALLGLLLVASTRSENRWLARVWWRRELAALAPLAAETTLLLDNARKVARFIAANSERSRTGADPAEAGDLAPALHALAAELAGSHRLRVRVDVRADVQVSPSMSDHLLDLCREIVAEVSQACRGAPVLVTLRAQHGMPSIMVTAPAASAGGEVDVDRLDALAAARGLAVRARTADGLLRVRIERVPATTVVDAGADRARHDSGT